jgi:acylphosphatase
MAACRFLVKGRVQGVGYRYFALREAHALGLGGFARNLPDGDVEVVAEGESDVLDAFAGRLGEGPFAASVTAVERMSRPPQGLTSFTIR